MGTQKESNFNPWLIVLGCVGCSAMLITILCNTAGMFLTPVMEEFGWSRTQASLYLTIYSWIAAALQPVIGKIYEKYENGFRTFCCGLYHRRDRILRESPDSEDDHQHRLAGCPLPCGSDYGNRMSDPVRAVCKKLPGEDGCKALRCGRRSGREGYQGRGSRSRGRGTYPQSGR